MPARQVVDDLVAEGCPCRTLVTGGSAAASFVLAGRLIAPDVVAHRAEYLRIVGAAPAGRLAVTFGIESAPAEFPDCVRSVAARAGLSTVVVADTVSPVDLLGLMASAELVVAGSPAMLTLSAGLGVPAMGVVPNGADDWAQALPWAKRHIADKPEQVPDVVSRTLGQAPLAVKDRLIRAADDEFDALASALVRTSSDRVAEDVVRAVADLIEQLNSLEKVNGGLRERLAYEREAMARHIRSLPPAALPDSMPELMALRQMEVEKERLQGEIDRIYATRTMRVLQPARRVYSRLRSRHR
jgi:hypothetical protein